MATGAYGCGVFRNDAAVVAALFDGLLSKEFKGRFRVVLFAIVKSRESLAAFEARFPMLSPADHAAVRRMMITDGGVGAGDGEVEPLAGEVAVA